MNEPAILKHMVAVADPVRCRTLRALEGQELTVSELCSVLQLPQSTVSRHLKVLADDGWLRSRREGACRYYGVADGDPPARRLWELVREQVCSTLGASDDARRLERVLTERRTRSQAFFSSVAGQWDRLRNELFGTGFQAFLAPALLDQSWVVGDLGCGPGAIAELFAPFVRQVIGVDASSEMLETARQRLSSFPNVDLRRGDLERLPLAEQSLDAAVLSLVLHYVAEPGKAFSEVARTLKQGGRWLLVDMLPHDRVEYQQQMGHAWLGFSEPQLKRLCSSVGLRLARYRALPPDPDAQGPGLFVAVGSR